MRRATIVLPLPGVSNQARKVVASCSCHFGGTARRGQSANIGKIEFVIRLVFALDRCAVGRRLTTSDDIVQLLLDWSR